MNLNQALSFILIFFFSCAFTQPTFEWVNSMGTISSDVGKEVVVDNDGNSYVIGTFRLVADFDPGPDVLNLTAFGSKDVFVQKLDPNGNLLWVKQFGGTNEDDASSIVIDSNADIIITGEFKGTADFDPNAGTNTLTATGTYFDTFIAKLDNNGNLIWVKQLDATHHCYAEDIDVNSNNEILLTGRWFETADFNPGFDVNNLTAQGIGWDIYILKLTSNGDFVWVVPIAGTDNNYVQAIKVDLNDDLLICGYYYETIDLNPGPGTDTHIANPNQEDMFIVKLDTDGLYLWGKNFSSGSTEISNSIEVDLNNDYYFGGYFSGSLDFDPGPGNTTLNPLNQVTDAFLLKLNSAGIFQWVKQIQGTSDGEIFSIALDNQGDVIIAGVFSLTADFNPGPPVENITSVGGRDIFFQKLSPDGSYHWTLTLGGFDDDYINSIAVRNGDIHATGVFRSTADFNPGLAEANKTSNGLDDIFVLKLGECTPGTLTLNQSNLPDLTGECLVAAPSPPKASDCGQTYDGVSDVSFPITTLGTTTITWTYDDGNGNTLTQTQEVIINDVSAPLADIATLPIVTSECSVSSLTAPSASDNCAGTITATQNTSLPITASTTINWTYDDGNGNTSTQTQEVIINDVSAPMADVATLPNVTSECSVSSLTAPTATDNCAGTITATQNSSLPITASTTINWSYDDGNGNTLTQTQEVVINDVSAPLADIATLPIVTSECSVTSLTAPTASDNCAGTITATQNSSLPITASTTINWTYDDGNGNTSTQTQEVVINDVSAPLADIATLPIVTSECSVTSLTAPTASDNCAGTISATQNTSLPITASTTINWTYDDGNGNTSTQTQEVLINDVSAPLADIATLPIVTSECSVTSLSAPTASDNCSGTISATQNTSLPITASTTISWTYDDGNGNTSTQNQEVIISHIDSSITQIDAFTLGAEAAGFTYQWVDCDNDNQPIPGETNQIFTAANVGNYAVEISNETCFVTSDCISLLTVGIETISTANVSVFPNPTNGVFFINSETNDFNAIVVRNVLGQKIEEFSFSPQQSQKFELTHQSGIYFIEIVLDSKVLHTAKIIKY